jgi:hypothetical protein
MGRLRWKDRTAALTPLSFLILSEILFAAWMVDGWRRVSIAATRVEASRVLPSRGRGPAPAEKTMLAQKG